jgi:hypothetical protein
MVESDPSGQSQRAKDPLADDPFFRLPADSVWNACIGKQGTEENYLDGYIEAAMELVSMSRRSGAEVQALADDVGEYLARLRRLQA